MTERSLVLDEEELATVRLLAARHGLF